MIREDDKKGNKETMTATRNNKINKTTDNYQPVLFSVYYSATTRNQLLASCLETLAVNVIQN